MATAPMTEPVSALLRLFLRLYTMPAANTNIAPRMKLDSSPTPALLPKGRCSRFFTSWMATPYTGPKEKVPSRAGRSEMSSLMKEGMMGIENSTNCSTAATADSMAATAR